MTEFVAVDSASGGRGDDYYIIGVAVEASSGSEFDEYYFDVVESFCEEYSINVAHPVIKTDTIQNQIPSYLISEARQSLAEDLIENPAIERIHVCIGWFYDDVEIPGRELSGINFAANYLNQYFSIVTLWDYNQSHSTYGVPAEAWVDNVSGKITRAWSEVGRNFHVNFVPYGDLTYPSISTADIIAGNLSRYLPEDQDPKDYPDIAESWLLDRVDDLDTVFVGKGSVNQVDKEYIVPNLPYSIKPEVHYPHPVIFLYDEMFSDISEGVLPQTDFHAFARKLAHEEAGCVVSMGPGKVTPIVRSGDEIIHTTGSGDELITLLQELNPTKDITVKRSDELIEQYHNGQ